MRYIKTFEELSPALVNKAKRSAENGAYGNDAENNPLRQNKFKQQYNKFSSYENPEMKEKMNSMGFGLVSNDGEYYITWSEGRIDKYSADSTITVHVKDSLNYKIVKGDLKSMPEQVSRRLLRAVEYLQKQLA